MSRIPLKHVVQINARTLPETTDPAFEFRYVDIGSVGRGKLVEEPTVTIFANAPSRARRLVRSGDTIISTVRTYLRAAWPIKDPADSLVVSTGFAVLSPGPSLDPNYLGWLVQSDIVVENVVARSVGVSYPAINPAEIGNICVPIPSILVQRTVADCLDAETARIDMLVAKKQRMIELLRESVSASISTATAAHAIEHRGLLPHGWRFVPLRRCFVSIDYGIGTPTLGAGQFAVLGMGNIEPGRIVGDPSGYVNDVDDRLLLKSGDLLFNRTNSLALVGKIALWLGASQPTTFASYLVRLRSSSLAENRYLNYLLNSHEILALARGMALPSIGQANLNPNRYTTMRVPLPPLHVQRAIVASLDHRLTTSEQITKTLNIQIDLLHERRQALINAAVTGGLNVPAVAA